MIRRLDMHVHVDTSFFLLLELVADLFENVFSKLKILIESGCFWTWLLRAKFAILTKMAQWGRPSNLRWLINIIIKMVF